MTAPGEAGPSDCGACGAPLRPGARFCRGCGAEAGGERTGPSAPAGGGSADAAVADSNRCAVCESDLRAGARFCRGCGNDVGAVSPDVDGGDAGEAAAEPSADPTPAARASAMVEAVRTLIGDLNLRRVLKARAALIGAVVAGIVLLGAVGWVATRNGTPGAEPVTQYATRLTRIRDAPTATGSVIMGSLQRGDAVRGVWVTGGDGETPWLRMDWGDRQTAYAWGRNLSDVAPPPFVRALNETRMIRSETTLRIVPGGADIETLSPGGRVELSGELPGGWYEVVRSNGGIGYVSAGAFDPPPVRATVVVLTPANAVDGWTTSLYPNGSRTGVPAGQDNEELRVGGWGDTYVSLIYFPTAPASASQVWLELYNVSDQGSPTDMRVQAVAEAWYRRPDGFLYWSDLPGLSDAFATRAAVTATQSWVRIDITEINRAWATGRLQNRGLALVPESNDNRFNEFVSSNSPDTVHQPRVVWEE